MNMELVAQMFKNYQSNVLFHLEGKFNECVRIWNDLSNLISATDNLQDPV